MTENEAIKKAIRYFECMKNDAVVVLDSGFGTHPVESDLVYRNRKMYAELAIKALEKQMPKKLITDDRYFYIMYICPCCSDFIKVSHNYCPNCGQKLDGGMKNE